MRCVVLRSVRRLAGRPDTLCGRIVGLGVLGLFLGALALPAVSADSGTVSPGTAGTAPPWDGASTWPFEPARDTFQPSALLDLRSLNEKTAGESGFVKLNADGDFVLGNGQGVRFWAVNSDVARGAFVPRPLWNEPAPDLARHARFLAKRGVNMVRQHRQISPVLKTHPSALATDINDGERDAIWRMVAAMKKEGIYSTISPYWAVPMTFSKDWGMPGGHSQSALGLLFFDETLQAAYKAWMKKLFADKNPYTGIALADDPSVAIVQLQNEDSLLFWSASHIQGAQRTALEARFSAFVRDKYGSIAQTLLAWQGDVVSDDAPLAGRLALLPIWELTQARTGRRAKRLTDQTEFLSRTMFDFNRSMVEYLRRDLGVKSLINAGNWKTASPARLNDAERWSYTAAEVDAANRYNGGVHTGTHRGWALVNGDQFTSESVLLNPHTLPINLKQTAGRPMLLTEGAWVMPNGFAAEGPFLIAAYSSLTGVDGYYWFATRSEGWTAPGSANGYLPSQGKWIFATPDMLGNFPAAALAYRQGYLRRGTPVVMENRLLPDVWARKTPVLAEESGFDPNRDAGDIAATSSVKTGVSSDAFLVGPVHVAFGADPAKSKAGPLNGLIANGQIRANTGEIVFDAVKGYCRIDAPMAQGVAAHFSTTPVHELSSVRFHSRNAFGAAMVVSLDGLPLKSSRRVLVQYGTQSRPTGWRETPGLVSVEGQAPVEGWTIQSVGKAPWQVVKAQLEVTVDNPALRSATVLDMNGMSVGTVPLHRSATRVSFNFPETAMYVVLQ